MRLQALAMAAKLIVMPPGHFGPDTSGIARAMRWRPHRSGRLRNHRGFPGAALERAESIGDTRYVGK